MIQNYQFSIAQTIVVGLSTQSETVTDACTANSSSVDVLAKSSKTTSFDISSSFDETWFSSMNTPLEIFFFDDNDNNNIFPNEYCFPIRESGTIPTEYGLLTDLTDLSSLDGKTLAGTIPSEIGLLIGLTSLVL